MLGELLNRLWMTMARASGGVRELSRAGIEGLRLLDRFVDSDRRTRVAVLELEGRLLPEVNSRVQKMVTFE